MEFFVSTAAPARQRTDCAIVGVYDKGVLSAAAEELDRAHRRTHRAAGQARRSARQDRRCRAARRSERRAVRTRRRARPRRAQRLQAQAVSQGARQRARRRGAHRRARRGQLSRPGWRRRCRRYALARIAVEVVGEFAVPHSRSQDGQQAAEADADQLRHRRRPSRGERGNAERGLAHGEASSPAWR